jgi:hypothetical protein
MSLRSILASEGLLKISKLRIPSDVDVTPVMQKAITAYEKLFSYGALRNTGSGTVTLSAFQDGYVSKKIPPTYGSYPSVGGDYNIGYEREEGQTAEVKFLVSLEVTFFPNDKVEVVLSEPVEHGRAWHKQPHRFENQRVTLYSGRGFGPKGVMALTEARKKFDYWSSQSL